MKNLLDFETSASASGDSGEFDLTGVAALDVGLICTQLDGTTPTLDVVIQEAVSQAGPWTTVATFAQLDDVGSENIALVVLSKPIVQVKWTLTEGPTTFQVIGNRSLYVPSVEIADPGDAGAIPVDRSGHCGLVTAAAETRTLADPAAPGLTLDLYCKEYAVGDAVVTVASPVNALGDNVITFGAAGDYCRLVSIEDTGDFEWRIAAIDGAVAS